MNRKLRLFKSEKGQSLVEFALVLPVLMMILLGIIEFGWLFNAQITLTSAAREGARVYAIEDNLTLITNAVNNASTTLKTFGDEGVKISKEPLEPLSGNIKMAKVKITADIIPLIGFFVNPEKVQLTAEASMRAEFKTTP